MSWQRCTLGPHAILTALIIDLFTTVSVLAACDSGDTERQLALAEEHRTWVELWTDLDNKEAMAELGYFSFRLRRAEQAIATLDCDDRERIALIQSRIRHEWIWHDRTYGLLTGTPFSGAASQALDWRVRTSQQLWLLQ